MTKIRYSAGLKIAAIAAEQVFSVILVLSILILAVLYQKDILYLGEVKDKSFESSGYFSSKFQETAEEILDFTDLRRKFETDGSYDSEKEVDIQSYYDSREMAGQTAGKKEKGQSRIRYHLGDLSEWSRGYSKSDFEFSSSYTVDGEIYQKRNIYKNGNSVLSEEITVSGLGEMTRELQDVIIQNVEHYYGGSYSVPSSGMNQMSAAGTDSVSRNRVMRELQGQSMSTEMDVAETSSEQMAEDSETSEKMDKIIRKVMTGDLYELDGEELALLLNSMDMSYVQKNISYEFPDEDYLPLEGTGIWDSFLKGRYSMEQMCSAYAALEYTLDNIGEEVNQYKKCLNLYNLTEDGTNVSYLISRGNEDVIYTNISEPVNMQLEEYGEKKGKYLFYQEHDIRLKTNVKGMEDIFYNRLEPRYGGKGSVLFISVDTSFPHQDSFLDAKAEYNRLHPWIYLGILGMVVSLVMCLIALIYLSMAAGRREEGGKVYLNLFDRIPTEVLYILAVLEGIACIVMIGEVFARFGSDQMAGLLIMFGVLTFFNTAFLLIFYLSFIRRIRAGVLWSSSILHWFAKGIRMLFTTRKSSAKMLFWFGLHLAACFLIFSLMLANAYDQSLLTGGTLCFLLLCAVEGVLIIREGVQRNKVLEGIRNISDGDLEYKIALEELTGDNRRLAEAVNAVGDGLFHAVDASMRNEHLKADLITNVSHDIKTPLTSIINYVDLLKREELPNERVQNYIAVLDSKSQRLKQLTEDLVEASKVSSGNIRLEMERINLVELVYQTGGEFNEKFEARNLTIITKLPSEPVVIMADGRRIWRVLENLYNNVAKYAMEHTRVYVDMEADGEEVSFSIKNISENPLNIQADELTERFIRGDISRSTEGSGLGLSIAKSLTGLMGGNFEIYLDGDLFKATIRFKQEPEVRRLPDSENEV